MKVRRSVALASVLAAVVVSASGCACLSCPAGSRRGASLGWAAGRFASMTSADARATADLAGGVGCALQEEVRQSSLAMCHTVNLYNGCHGHGGE